MSEDCRKIKIIGNNQNFCLFVKNNKLKKSLLSEYFPQKVNVTYKVGDDKFMLECDTDNVFLIPNIDSYYFTNLQGLFFFINIFRFYISL